MISRPFRKHPSPFTRLVVIGSSSNIGVERLLNLEKAPWWRKIFKTMIKARKRCLKRKIGRANITYDEWMIVVSEAEVILNCRPLSYVSKLKA